ncbi:hypothetical protein A2160_00030 [Candidatus Beckwithbacteria bacterium RBG_13_42_9]|uniref:Uncharacterized protein n=1 Tax=Candidatus Beckwithbacteria bacterium RBG_13_42_9 TaxID=1797457 RepID=A0A1F5E431_9BACT|nr:MAG: hypothetical protein A2160_00030 [Candidatus Beckwithbacteria bacterium RBG_13_42_9]
MNIIMGDVTTTDELAEEVSLWQAINANADRKEAVEEGYARVRELLTTEGVPFRLRATTAIARRCAEWSNSNLYARDEQGKMRSNVDELEALDRVKGYLFQHVFVEPQTRAFFNHVYRFMTRCDGETWERETKQALYGGDLLQVWDIVKSPGLWDRSPSAFNTRVMELAIAKQPPSSYLPKMLEPQAGQ